MGVELVKVLHSSLDLRMPIGHHMDKMIPLGACYKILDVILKVQLW